MAKFKQCSGCGSLYEVSWTRFRERDDDFKNCEVCGQELARWNTSRVPSYVLVKKGDRKLEGET